MRLSDSLPVDTWIRLRARQLGDGRFDAGAWQGAALSDELPMSIWRQVRDRQARGDPAPWEEASRVRTIALAAPAETTVRGVTVTGPPRPVENKPLTGRPGTAAIVAGAINRIVAAPNTSSEVRIPRVEGTLTRGAGRDVHGRGRVMGKSVGVDATLDPPTGRAEVSVSGVTGRGVELPSHARIYDADRRTRCRPSGADQARVGHGEASRDLCHR